MDKHLIIEFDTKAQGQTFLSVFETVAVNYWQSQGYTVIDALSGKAIVGKNSLTNEDNIDALTTAWDTLKKSPDGTFYLTSPSPDPRFKDWRDFIPDIYLGVEKEFPEEWLSNDE